MLRIHFTFEDLALTCVADSANRGMEVMFSLHVLHGRPRDIRFRRWLRTTRRAGASAVLSQLCSPVLMPGFLCPAVEPDPRDTSGNALRLDSDVRRSNLRLLARYRKLTPFAQALADDDRKAGALFAETLGAYQHASVENWMPQIDVLLGAERHDWARQAAAGPGRLLQNLHPRLAWTPPVLQVESTVDLDLHLNGRGILIQPTFFIDRPWVGGIDNPHLQPMLCVPLRRKPALGEHEPETPETLIHLLGRTRATVLRLIAHEGPCGTGDIARRLDCSPTSVSDHTAVLRDSGLISTVRSGQSVRHTVTELGEALIDGKAG